MQPNLNLGRNMKKWSATLAATVAVILVATAGPATAQSATAEVLPSVDPPAVGDRSAPRLDNPRTSKGGGILCRIFPRLC